MILDITSGQYGWMAIPAKSDGHVLDVDADEVIQQVKEVWLSGGNFTQEQVDNWHYIIVPYRENMIGVVILYEDICN